jgi:DNA-binding transcriptional LysR family regulator
MELRHLRYFVAVAETQNVTRAAARLHLSQPALSRQIHDLEDELGFALFAHQARSVRLTEAGRVFLTEAQAVLLRAEQAVQTAKAVAAGQKGEIHVGYAPSLAVEILPAALRAFQLSDPGVRVRLHDLSTQEMLQWLRDEKLQVALLIRPSRKGLTGLIFEELRKYAVCVALSPAHPLAKQREVTLESLASERLIGFTRLDYPDYYDWIDSMFGQPKKGPIVAEEHDSATSLIAAVEAGRGVAVVTKGFECLVGPRLKIRPLTPAPPAAIVGVAYADGRSAPHTQHFISAVKAGPGSSV